MRQHITRLAALIAVLTLTFTVVGAQDFNPTVEVSDQVSVDGTVTIDRAISDGPGFIVIHADNDGTPGEVLGFRSIPTGEVTGFKVPVDFTRATPVLYTMLHFDNSEVGTYEFDGTEGIDGPVVEDGVVISPSFEVTAISVRDRFVGDDGNIAIDAVVSPQSGWMVGHADNGEGAPGPVIGVTFLEAGAGTNIPVTLDGEITPVLFPMLHEDTGEEGQYEFGSVDGADNPVVIDGVAATARFENAPNVVATQQIVSDTFTADWVLSDGPGWLVIHANNNGQPGEVLGAEFVQDGYNEDVTVSLNTDGNITPVLWPMLHVDTGEEGVYEFGEVDGVDGPATGADGAVETFPIVTANGMTGSDQPLEDGTVTVASALIDGHGWLVVHADNGEGAPGPVIGVTPLLSGLNENVGVLLNLGDATSTVFPMLHTDTGELGAYEFSEVDGVDGPVLNEDGTPVILPIELTDIE
ncbi:MAG: hypothetical protein AAF125_02225 [Chloroflexota bacterium]